MHERHSTTPESVSPRHSHPAELGGVAVARMTERPATPEVDIVNVEQQESERKKNTMENLRALQKRFGERFVKGELMEGGGYAGGAARELLAGFMDQAGFASELKTIIPNKHGALALLKDNHDYIQASLEQRYKDGPRREREPARDPYELARSAGYELTGPFTSTSEFVPLDKQDFRPNERLCTFNNPVARLEDYNILWLRHTDVEDTLPADELTADTLSEPWKTYLRTTGRYDRDADSYDLTGLRPARDDPYGTSSMSVQISRKGTHVSVKNRYNHTVGNPDNTLDSNLDNVTYGLKRAVYARVGREDLMNKTSVSLAEGYHEDNEGGIHAYKYEEDNVYYGDYEYIQNGVVTTIDRGKYDMISPQLYVPKSGKGEELRLGWRKSGIAGFDVPRDLQFLYESSKAESGEKDPRLAERRREYAERDRIEVTRGIHETLAEQVRTTYDAYRAIAMELGASDIMTEASFAALFDRKQTEWQESGVVDYLVKELIESNSWPELVATPNVLADWKDLKRVAQEFGKRQPYETYTYDKLYTQYSAEQLSGAAEDGALRLSIIPSKRTRRLDNMDASAQRAELAMMQRENPRLNLHVPSVLTAVAYWKTRRARGDALDDRSAYDKTYIRHFDLPDRRDDVGWSYVPLSYVYAVGEPYLGSSGAADGDVARVAVG